MNTIRLVDKELYLSIIDIPVFTNDELYDLTSHWIETKSNDSIFLMFQNVQEMNIGVEHDEFIVTELKDNILNHIKNYDEFEYLNMCIMEFKSYQEAFSYLLELKE